MNKTKLTLTINPILLAQTKALAKERGSSLSSLVEGFFERFLTQAPPIQEDPWVTEMDNLLASIRTDRPDPEVIEKEIIRDHDDFERALIDDLSQEFLK